MNSRTPFRIGIVGVSFLFAGALVATVDQTPMSWMKATLLQSLGATSSVAQAASFDHDTQGNALQLVKQGLPAAKQDSPEVLELKKMGKVPQKPKPINPSQAGLLADCMKRPDCAAELDAFKKGKIKPPPTPFQGELPEELKKKQRNKKGQGPVQPRSDIRLPEESPSLLSWLNPFLVTPAYAQTASNVITVYPGQLGYQPPPGNTMDLYGVYLTSGWEIFDARYYYKSLCTVCQNHPYALLVFTVPQNGVYNIEVNAFVAGSRKATIYHANTDNRPGIVKTWDDATIYAWASYTASKTLFKGENKFYFWPNSNAGLTYMNYARVSCMTC
ncbi:MAG: hypothetical protein OEV70_11525 [Nitrospirota bacterium]|nr:hypothetical protein [Nitrospirota bacterium]